MILVSIFLYIVTASAFSLLPEELQGLFPILAVITLLLSVTSAFLLALRLYGIVVGIIIGLLTIAPYVGLVALFFINFKASNLLQAHGISVGMLGADTPRL